ncbi:MAG TPA: indole-3-glycerol phosphate synthase TrpC [Candidatus Acidoferrales bacterium]|nr:indole-3-glycerol phosphate synthase TrpC [Candidatus Acidoferrales bacterium]
MIASELLARLVAEAGSEMHDRRQRRPAAELEREVGALPPPRDFAAALREAGLSVVAEMKARTPSAGVLAEDYRPGRLARAYTEGGAAALSVLTQGASFGGRLEHLGEARAASPLPVLRKDFLTEEYQVLEARAAGADAVLLIVAVLRPRRLNQLLAGARGLGLEALVEVHDERELEEALLAGARVLGVNHRDLATFSLDLGLTERLAPLVPPGTLLVAESGIRDAADARRVWAAGANAVLVGEALMRAPDPAARIRELRVNSA